VDLLIERYAPLSLSAIGVAIYLLFYRNCALPTTLAALFGATISIASIAVGFFATAKTAVVQLEPKRPLIQKLRQAERFELFLKYLTTAIHVSFALAVLSALGLVVDFSPLDWRDRILFAAWLFSALFAALSYYRVVRVLNVILDAPPPKQ
jgi:hypothetical protein